MNEILIYGGIGVEVTSALVAAQLKEMEGPVTVRMNSSGGDAMEGMAIHNLLKQYQGEVTVIIDGGALSAASLIAMAGDNVQIAENALLMLHDPYQWAQGNPQELRRAADTLEKYVEAVATSYASKTGLSLERVRELMSNETWLTAPEALELGFVDEVIQASAIAASIDYKAIMEAQDADCGVSEEPEDDGLTEETDDEPELTMKQQSQPYIEAFGQQGAVWFCEGKALSDCWVAYAKALESKVDSLASDNEQLKVQLKAQDVSSGEEEPLSMSPAVSEPNKVEAAAKKYENTLPRHMASLAGLFDKRQES